MTLPEKLQQIVDEFTSLEDRADKHEQLLWYAKKLPEFDQHLKTPLNKVGGCVSDVYIVSTLGADGLHFQGASSSVLVKGLVAILVIGLDGIAPTAFLELDESFLTTLGLQETLTPSRANASVNILALMKKQVKELS